MSTVGNSQIRVVEAKIALLQRQLYRCKDVARRAELERQLRDYEERLKIKRTWAGREAAYG